METIKFLIVGDGNVGKTSMLIMFTTDTYPDEYIPTVLDNYKTMFWYKNKPMRMEIWDTAGQEEYKYLRPLSYEHTDVFFLCFSLVDPTSYSNAETSWYSEIKHYCPNSIVILVGTKKDLRDDQSYIQKLKTVGKFPITFEDGQRFARRINAYDYMECSALKRDGLKELFNCGTLAAIKRRSMPHKPRICSIL